MSLLSGFTLPNDSAYNPKIKKILVSVHMYLPHDFAMNGDMSKNYFSEQYKNELEDDFKTLYERFVKNGNGSL